MSQPLRCWKCAHTVESDTWVWCCPACGGPLDFVDAPSTPELVSLGEPETPIVDVELGRLTVIAKLEGALPTGSFKDRGSRFVATALRDAGVERAVIDSSGNAGASLAAYCARACVRCEVYAPASASPAKLAMISAFGARVHAVPGTRQDVANAALAAADSAAYAAHSWSPWFIVGTSTFATEVHAQLGRPPDAIVLPVGAGTLLLGIARGFAALARAGRIERAPRIFGVQSNACAPLAQAFERRLAEAAPVTESSTAAEGIKIAHPPRGAQILEAVRTLGGAIVAVSDAELWSAFERLASQGVLVEPTSAVAFAGIAKLPLQPHEMIVVPVTGTGLKTVAAGPALIPREDVR